MFLCCHPFLICALFFTPSLTLILSQKSSLSPTIQDLMFFLFRIDRLQDYNGEQEKQKEKKQMSNFPQNKKVFLIGEPLYHPTLLKLKEKDPALDMKVLSPEEVISLLSFHYVKDPIPYLLSFGKYDYSRAKKLAKILPIYERGSLEELDTLVKNLDEKGYLAYDPLGKKKLENKAIYLFEDDEDRELKALFDRNHISYSLLHLRDLPMETHPLSFPIYLFKDKFLQYFYLFADLRKRIVNDKEKAEDFTLIGNSNDVYYLSFFSKIFKIPFALTLSSPILTDSQVKQAIRLCYEKNRFEDLLASAPREGSPLSLVKEKVITYGLDKLPFESAYASLMEIISSYGIGNTLSEEGIPFSSSLVLKDKKIILTDFVYNSFYKVYSDDNIFPDKELERIQVNTSYDLTALDKRKKENYLSLANIISASRVKIHLQDKIYPSQFLAEKGLKEVEKEVDDEGCYTEEAKNLLLSYLKDRDHAVKGDGYRTFDPSFTPIQEKREHQVSVTDFSIYADCPFKFYLDRILHVEGYDPNRDVYPMALGNLTHRVMEDIYSPDYDYEKEFEKGKVDFYLTYKSNHSEVPASATTYLEVVKFHFKDFVDVIRSQRENNKLTGEKREAPITLQLQDSKGNYKPIKGRIDKIVYSNGNNDNYYTIVDYKSGHEAFHPKEVFLGKSLQLPLYWLAIKGKDELTQSGRFGGFGIQRIYNSTYPMDGDLYDEKGYQTVIKISGVVSLIPDYLENFDSSTFETKNDGTQDLTSTNKAKYVLLRYFYYPDAPDSPLSKTLDYTYDEMIEDAIKSAGEILTGIGESKYPIHPLCVTKQIRSDSLPCQYCPYRNICYRRLEDVNHRYDDIQSKFNREKESDDGDTL